MLPLGITSDYLAAVKPHGMFRTFVRSLRESNGNAVNKNLDYKYIPGNGASNEVTVTIKSSTDFTEIIHVTDDIENAGKMQGPIV